MSLCTNFLDKKIIIANHCYSTAFPQHMEEFLISIKVKKLFSIRHPLHPEEENYGSNYEIFENGTLSKKGYLLQSKLPSLLRYFQEMFLDFWWVLKTRQKWDLYFGSNNLNTFAGILLRKIGLVKKVVFYTVDFVPHRFNNQLLNNFYHWVDKFGVINSDEVWILSPRMRDGRKKYYGLDKKYDKKQIIVPEGVWVERIKKPPFTKIKYHTAVYVGHLCERMGVQLVIKSIPEILKTIKDFKFIIIGKGEYRSQLEKLVKKLNLRKIVQFTGFIEDHREVEKIIANCGVGVAVYQEDEESLTFYAEPAKTKLYLGASIPVIMTNSFYNAEDIEKAGAGRIAKYDPKEVAKILTNMLKNKGKLKKYHRKALEFAQYYAYPDIFIRNLNRVFKN